MASAGYCAQCQDNVWLTPTGACPRGHDAGQISNVYDVPAPGAAPPAPVQPAAVYAPVQATPAYGPAQAQLNTEPTRPAKKSRTGCIVAAVLVVLLGCCAVAGILFAIAIPIFFTSQSGAQEKVCFANERMVEGAAQMYAVDNKDAMPESMDTLVSSGLLKSIPTCPADGEYTYKQSDGTLTCSIHGHF